MIDEEMAKEYIQNGDVFYNNKVTIKSVEQAFLAGLKAGRPKWHKVADGDLPKEDIYLVIRLNDENTCYKCCTGFWEKEERYFHTLFCNKVDTKDIIAWKEIVLPELPKEENK